MHCPCCAGNSRTDTATGSVASTERTEQYTNPGEAQLRTSQMVLECAVTDAGE